MPPSEELAGAEEQPYFSPVDEEMGLKLAGAESERPSDDSDESTSDESMSDQSISDDSTSDESTSDES